MKAVLRTYLAGVVTICSIVLAGLSPLATAQAAAYHCGSVCNGKAPSSPISSNGITCSHSARQLAAAHPSASYNKYIGHGQFEYTNEADTAITIKVMYSSVCQTMWAVVANTHSGVPASCKVSLVRTASPTWSGSSACPAGGASKTSVMVNDYVASQTVAAHISYSGSLKQNVCTGYGNSGECRTITAQYVPYTYTKSY